MTYYIDESLSDTEFTATALVRATFGVERRFESITIHHWGSFGQTHDGVNDFFVNRNRNTSAHFVASDGRINCLVSPANASWAAGNAYGNATSIHIEARPEATDGDYRTVSWLVHWLRSVYGNLPLKAHREWSATACPGIWDLARVDREARAWASATITPAATPEPPKGWDELATKEEIKAAYQEVLDANLDKIALAILKRPCYLIDPATGQVKGTTTLATKINWMAYNDQAILNAVVDVSKKLDVAHPVLPIPVAAEAGAEAEATHPE